MRRLLFASLCIFAFAGNTGFGEDKAAVVETEPATALSAVASNADSFDQTVAHLLKAAEHLEAAGMTGEAARLRSEAKSREVRDGILSRKEAELECLQVEVDRLRSQAGQVPGVIIKLVAVEVDRKKLGLKARDFDKLTGLVDANPTRLPLFKELRDSGAICVLGELVLATASGRPASFLDGGLTPVRVRSAHGETSVSNVWFGIQMEVLAVLLPNQRVRLQTSFERRVRHASDIIDDDGTEYPGFTTRRLNGTVEMQLGQTLALGRVLAPRPNDPQIVDVSKGRKAPARTAQRPIEPPDSVEYIVFVTPELDRAAETPRALHPVPASAEVPEESSRAIAPAAFIPNDSDVFGPVMPVLKRRPVRD